MIEDKFILIISFLIFLIGAGLLWIVRRQKRKFGILSKEHIYKDTELEPGEVLYAKSVPLIGKPDYLVRENEDIIPVEVKTGKTPESPYVNHTMQLMAYCLLVEESYGKRPLGGYLRYPEKEFKIAYTDEAKEAVKTLVKEIIKLKKSDAELTCNHPEHN